MNTFNDYFLSHHGINGQRRGVRRYQNEDGTYTHEGLIRKRLATGYKGFKKGIKSATTKKRLNKANKKISTIDSINDSTRDIYEHSTSIFDRFAPGESYDLSEMTDADLQKFINRYNLEQNYLRIKGSESSSRGREIVEDVLDTAGDILSVSGSAIAILLSLKALKGGK